MGTNVKVVYDSHGDTEPTIDGEDSWSDHTIIGIELPEKEEYFDIIVPFEVKKGESYYLVYATHTSDDSFNHRSGYIHFVNMYQKKEVAEENCRCIIARDQKEDSRYGYDNKKIMLLNDDDTEEEYYISAWGGYFDRLEDVYIQEVSVVKYKKRYTVPLLPC